MALNQQRKTFAKNVALGMNHTQAARSAGYAFPNVAGAQMIKIPEIREAVEKEQRKYEAKADMTRQKVMDGLVEAIEVAKLQADAQGMVAGWREIIKICGYQAPEVKKLDISINGVARLTQIETMSDEELAKAIIEGESIRLEDDEDGSEDAPVASLPHLSEPDDRTEGQP